MGESTARSEVSRREEEILAFWNERGIFAKSLEKHAPKGDFAFYDGPPFATGLPHYGHLLQSAIKDAVPRYKTMCGYRVPRQWGWDCHGLPIENIVEKEIGSASKKDIEAIGVEKFNNLCREQIFTFIKEWERIIPRIGRWADMEHPYRTMDFAYMQSEWWAFKTLYEKGLIYEAYRSMHICPRCETTLSQGEVAEGYKEVKDLSATVKFKVKNPEKHNLPENTYLLAWTTTPWTLPGNVALAVGTDIEYVIARGTDIGEVYVLAKKLHPDAKGSDINPGDLVTGSALVGIEYEPLFDTYASDEKLPHRENGWKVYAADFVTTETGTGIVHIAPAYGADDMQLGKEKNLPFVQHVGIDGKFKPEMGEFADLDLKPRAKDKPEEIREADLTLVRALGDKVFSTEKYEHSYPHCWRCDTALLNYATSSWFVAVEKQKELLLRTAEDISWSPEHMKEGRFGEWLKGARDWSISRQRFWANTIPVWRCEGCAKECVFGSARELHEASGVEVTDLHRDYVDAVTIECECGATMRRVPDVLDTWFDSGSVPFASLHYPLEHTEEFTSRLPADFIAEAQDQCRAWFYYQHVLSGALFGTHAFKNVIATGIVLAEDGKKMSKKLKNYPDPMSIVDTYGADAMRYYMLSAPIVRAETLNFSEKGVDEVVKKHIGRLHNVLAFYQLHVGEDSSRVPRDFSSPHPLDQWIVARTSALIGEVTEGYETYRLDVANRPLALFIDDLSVWYIRRSRERFKEEGEDKVRALATLRYVLHTLSKIMAPSMPFYAEYLFQAVKEEEDEESVHLSSWPEMPPVEFNASESLAKMFSVRLIVSQALEMRDAARIKVRQPLARLHIPADSGLEPGYLSIIADEVNVKEVVPLGETTVLDTEISEELREEGIVRDHIRAIQAYRKEQGLRVGEPARYVARVSPEEARVIEKHREHMEHTTTTAIELQS